MGKTVLLGGGFNGMGACGYNPAMGYGYGCGIPPFGMIGMWPGGFGGWGRGGCGEGGGGAYPAALVNGGRIEGNVERQLEMVSDNMNSRFNDVNGDVRTSRIEGSVGGVKDQIGHVTDRMFTKALSDKDSYFGLEKSICGVDRDVVIMAKDIIASQKDCCCQQKEIALAEGCKTRETIHCEAEKTRHLMGEIERARQAERLCAEQAKNVELKGQISNMEQTAVLERTLGKQRDEMFGLFNQLGNRITSIEGSNQNVINNFGTLTSQIQALQNSLATGTTA